MIDLNPEDNRGRNWTDAEDLILLEHGPGHASDVTGRTYASCQSRYNRRGYHLLDDDTRQRMIASMEQDDNDPTPSAVPPTVTSITGVQAGEKPDVQKIIAKHRDTFQRAKELAERKRNQSISISHGPAMIALVSDTHLGNPGTDVDRVFAEQDLINSTPGAYTVLLGDIADSFLVGRLRDLNMTHDVTVPEEWELVTYYVNRWKNLVGFVGGNHDAWSKTLVGRDLHRDLIADGKVLYDSDDMRVTFHVGDHAVKFRMRHQFLGSSQYNVSHAQEKSFKFDDPDPDIVVSGHTHTGALARELTHAGKRKIAIQLGSYKPIDDFATRIGFPQADASTAAAVIIMEDGSYFATGSLRAACRYMRDVYGGKAA